MKRMSLLVALAAMVSLALVAGCGVKPQPLNPVQIASVACPQINLLHDQFAALNSALSANPTTANAGNAAAAVLAKVDPIAKAVCNGVAANPAVSVANLQTLIQTGLPALGNLAMTLPMTPQQQAAVQGGLAVSETLVALVNALQAQSPAGASSTVLPAAPASAASAAKP